MLNIKSFNKALVKQVMKIAREIPKRGAYEDPDPLTKEHIDEFVENYNKDAGDHKKIINENGSTVNNEEG